MKTEDTLSDQAKRWAARAWAFYLLLYVVSAGVTIEMQARLMANFYATPILWAFPAITLIAILAVGHFNHRNETFKAFLASSVAVVGIVATGAAWLFPNMVPAINDPSLMLTDWEFLVPKH